MAPWNHIVSRMELERAVTHRDQSIFQGDMAAHDGALRDRLLNARVLVIGAAGSIGSATSLLLSRYPLARMSLIDVSENNLVELVRDLRSCSNGSLPAFDALPIFLGSAEFNEYLARQDSFDFVFNFSALKHVRSEKSSYSLKRLLRTNVLEVNDLLWRLPVGGSSVYSVSSDKSVNPGNLMGASKALMEQVLWWHSSRFKTCTARFANVAFSDGSLLYGILQRLRKQQPVCAPSDVKRFFISHHEAAELSLLAGVLGQTRDIFVPAAALHLMERSFASVATEVLQISGYEPVVCTSEREAKELVASLPQQNKWPCYFSPSDTSGEKPYEEFVGASETPNPGRFRSIEVVNARFTNGDAEHVSKAISELEALLSSDVSKADIVAYLKAQIPTLRHVETHRSLDEKM